MERLRDDGDDGTSKWHKAANMESNHKFEIWGDVFDQKTFCGLNVQKKEA